MRQATGWEEIFSHHVSDIGFVSGIREEFSKRNNKKQPKDLSRHFTKEGIRRSNKYMKRYAAPLVIREMKIKPTRYTT